ncbi:MAG TPA: hypothetical protein VN213_06785 [Solirubrobacteraceae bacterium]|nr:hypothetical protein [Solirubrobacteraceae bacterium]
MTHLEHLQHELRTLRASQAYAFAMGHGCTIGDHPRFREIRRRERDLLALIAEFSDD